MRAFLAGRLPACLPLFKIFVSKDTFPLSRLARLTVTQRFLFHKGSFLPNVSGETNALSTPDLLGELILLLVFAAVAAVSVTTFAFGGCVL